MVNASIVQYIQQEISQGYSIKGIRQYLLSAGYLQHDVDEAIHYVQNLGKAPDYARQQRVQQLASYIQTQSSAFPVETLQQFLLQRGYPQDEVNEAASLSAPTAAPPGKGKLIIGIIALVVIVSVITSILVNIGFIEEYLGPKEDKLLDLKAIKLTSTPKPGTDLVFKTEIYNLGAKRRYDIVLTYELENADTNKVVASETESLAIETSTSRIFSVEIPPSAEPGDYTVKVRAAYEEQVAEAGFLFKVYEKARVITKEEAAQDVEEIPTTVVTKEEFEEAKEPPPEEIKEDVPEEAPEEEGPSAPIVPPPSDGRFEGMSRKEAFEFIRRIAVVEPEESVEMCTEFTYQGTVDSCFTMLAQEKDDGSFCTHLELNRTIDSCYIQLAISNNNYENCADIVSDTLRKSCESLEKTSALGRVNLPPQ